MSSSPQGPRRIGQWLYLKPSCIDAYKKCHAAVWPEVLLQIKDSNIIDCASPILPQPNTHAHVPYPQIQYSSPSRRAPLSSPRSNTSATLLTRI